MKLIDLHLHNIGPFIDQKIEFFNPEEQPQPPIVIITGENGSGKTIIVDSIRYLFYGFNKPQEERDIVRNYDDFFIKLSYYRDNQQDVVESHPSNQGSGIIITKEKSLSNELYQPTEGSRFIFDYWTSKLSTDSFEVKSVTAPEHEITLRHSPSGVHKNAEISKLLIYFDYLRSSDDEFEKSLGNTLYELTKKIFNISISNGKFKKVQRQTLKPIVEVNGIELTMEKLSSGNLYLLQRLISLLGKAYAIFSLRKERVDINEITNIPGILIIDEAENHLHPKWQKTFLNDIISIFPNLQIIVTTHSPFIVSSVKDAKVFVCQNAEGQAKIIDATETYSNKPIDEILTTQLFNTSPFSKEITDLMHLRKDAIEHGNKQEEERLEAELLKLNPQYFSFLNLEKILKKGGQK